jgi:hypothetical protein
MKHQRYRAPGFSGGFQRECARKRASLSVLGVRDATECGRKPRSKPPGKPSLAQTERAGAE